MNRQNKRSESFFTTRIQQRRLAHQRKPPPCHTCSKSAALQPARPYQQQHKAEIQHTPHRQRNPQHIIRHGTIAEAADNRLIPIKQRPVAQTECPRRTAGRSGSRRQALDIKLVHRHTRAVNRGDTDQYGTEYTRCPARLARKCTHQRRQPHPHHGQPLQNAQYARVQPQHILRIKRAECRTYRQQHNKPQYFPKHVHNKTLIKTLPASGRLKNPFQTASLPHLLCGRPIIAGILRLLEIAEQGRRVGIFQHGRQSIKLRLLAAQQRKQTVFIGNADIRPNGRMA